MTFRLQGRDQLLKTWAIGSDAVGEYDAGMA
jgi:hypothetical protein